MRDNDIAEYTPIIGINYFDYYLKYNNPGTVQKREIRAAILRLNDHCADAAYTNKHSFFKLSSIPESFSLDVNRFLSSPKIASAKKSTINRRKRALARFLINCTQYGTSNAEKLSPYTVIFASKNVPDIDDWIVIRQFLRFLVEEGITEKDLSTFVPKGRRDLRIPSTYSVEEIKLLESTVDRSSYQGKRDYIVLLLASRLAIRSGDIACMRLENLDFKKNTIHFFQKKTGNEITLPMIPELKDALIKYIEETNTEDGYLFHTLRAPYHPLGQSAIYDIVNKYFSLAGVDISNKKHGPCALRASVSTSMINDDIPYDVVRSFLGHASPNAIRHYAKNDIEKLRRCSISVPNPSREFLDFLKGGI